MVSQVCGPPGMIRHLSGEKPNPREQGEVFYSIERKEFNFLFVSILWLPLMIFMLPLSQLTGLLKDVGFTENMVYKF